MSDEFVDIINLKILRDRYDGSTTPLYDILEVDIKSDDSSDVVTSMNPKRRARGHKSGVMVYDVTLKSNKAMAPEMPWRQMHRSKEVFQIMYEEGDGGARYQLVDCKIMSVGNGASKDGESTLDISIKPLDEIELT